ncbi:MAG TPA: XdhC/CoxI family protein, partial [Flavisolibacter sp.]|nr:XdhC/CoxI family protein [Flavisolibacter sp.]
RRAGARMLITEDGQLTGAISGGCLEGDALRKAQLVLNNRKTMVVTYDTMDEDDAKLGVGLGCNGIIHILIEPIQTNDPANVIELLRPYVQKRQRMVLITLFCFENKQTNQPGTCLVMEEDGKISIKNNIPIKDELIEDAKNSFINSRSQVKLYLSANSELTGFIELLKPPISLVVFGAGNDTIPLMKMANVLGWNITIVDGRPGHATWQRFPLANKLIIAKPQDVLPQLITDQRTAVILMTHNYNYDLAILEGLLPRHISYIGVLGPGKKLQRMLFELNERGVILNEDNMLCIYGPTGLDLGAETSEEIALSIISEIQLVFSDGKAISLRDKKTFIHPREDHLNLSS